MGPAPAGQASQFLPPTGVKRTRSTGWARFASVDVVGAFRQPPLLGPPLGVGVRLAVPSWLHRAMHEKGTASRTPTPAPAAGSSA